MPPKTRSTTTRKPAAKQAPAKRKSRSRKRIKVKVTFALFTCKTCKKPYNLPWFHTCMLGFSAKQAAAARRNLKLAREAKQRGA